VHHRRTTTNANTTPSTIATSTDSGIAAVAGIAAAACIPKPLLLGSATTNWPGAEGRINAG
jgi:predicted phage gp36 major capsid-like protein